MILARVREAISSPTTAELSIVCDEEIDEDAALGEPALITIDAGDAGVRRFHLIVTAIELDARTIAERRRYNVELAHELQYLRYAPELSAADRLLADALETSHRLARTLR